MGYDEVILDGPLVVDADGHILGQWLEQRAILGREISVPILKPMPTRWTGEDAPYDVSYLVARFGYREHKMLGYVLVLTTDTPEIRDALSRIKGFKVLW